MMIRVENGDDCFNYRVVGVAVHDDCVLLHQAEGDVFWTFPGGRAELGESAEQTLLREMREEIGIEVKVVRLLWVVENFFTYGANRYHEVSLYFLMQLPRSSLSDLYPGPFQGKEEAGPRLTFQWFQQRAEVLKELPVFPSFLQTAVQELPESTRHVVQDDRQ